MGRDGSEENRTMAKMTVTKKQAERLLDADLDGLEGVVQDMAAGLDAVKIAAGYASDYNVFLEGAKKSSFGDEHSIVDSSAVDFSRKDDPAGATIGFTVGDALFGVKGPWVDGKLVGTFPRIQQTIEDRHGNPITVDTDLGGRKRTQPVAGPLADLERGRNTITWSMRRAGQQVE